MINRGHYARRVEDLGKQINNLRNDLNETGAPFSAGLVRAAEEALLIVMNALQDNGVPENEL